MKKFFFALLSMAAMTAFAQMTPVGLWHTIDDETNQPKGEVRIFEKDGVLVGVVGRALKEDPNAKPNCDKCVDDRKGQPIIGMEILRGLKREGKEADNLWAGGGKILDPTTGKIYTVKMVPQEGGKKLQVRGYIGPFYRTQTWLRAQ